MEATTKYRPVIEAQDYLPGGEVLIFRPKDPAALLWLSEYACCNSGWAPSELGVLAGPKHIAEELYEKLIDSELFKVERR